MAYELQSAQLVGAEDCCCTSHSCAQLLHQAAWHPELPHGRCHGVQLGEGLQGPVVDHVVDKQPSSLRVTSADLQSSTPRGE